jgi:hypothetical protein
MYASHLWGNTGLADLFKGIIVDGRQACGLNPHIRIYRHEHNFGFACPLLLAKQS